MAPLTICRSRRHLVGKVAIVTGANTGIGYETAKDFANRGARVILACRDETRGAAARDKIAQVTENYNIVFKKIDLSSLATVREFAKDVLETESRLDILVNNAGALGLENKPTEDGLNLMMQVNYFGHFLLTILLLPLLKRSAPSRIVIVASSAHTFGKLNIKDLNFLIKYPSDIEVYGITKMCTILMGRELARRLQGTEVIVNSCHPGIIETEIRRNIKGFSLMKLADMVLTLVTPYEGAQTSIHLAVCRGVKGSGEYYDNCKVAKPSCTAQNDDLARLLYEESAKLTQCSPDI